MKATMKGRRVFYFSVFLLLALLLVGTMAFAEGSGPYSLTIRKVLPDGSPPEAFQQSYKFKVSGVEKSGDENKPFSKVVTITGPGEAAAQPYPGKRRRSKSPRTTAPSPSRLPTQNKPPPASAMAMKSLGPMILKKRYVFPAQRRKRYPAWLLVNIPWFSWVLLKDSL